MTITTALQDPRSTDFAIQFQHRFQHHGLRANPGKVIRFTNSEQKCSVDLPMQDCGYNFGTVSVSLKFLYHDMIAILVSPWRDGWMWSVVDADTSPRHRYYVGRRHELSDPGADHVAPPAPPDPLDLVIDGVSLGNLLEVDEATCRDEGYTAKPKQEWKPTTWTVAQRAAISYHRSAELRAKISAGESADAAEWRKQRNTERRICHQVVLDCSEDL